jgi:hypothetical protein
MKLFKKCYLLYADNTYFWEGELKVSYIMPTSFYFIPHLLNPWAKMSKRLPAAQEEGRVRYMYSNEGVADGGGQAVSKYDEGAMNVEIGGHRTL